MNPTIFNIIFIIAGIAVVILLIYLLNKLGLKGKYSGYLALFIGFIATYVVHQSSTMTYVVIEAKNGFEVTETKGFGSSSYIMSTGKDFEEAAPTKNCLVFNDTDKPLVVEKVSFGTEYGGGPIHIPPFSAGIVDAKEIDYFPDDTPPAAIKVRRGSSGESKVWLRERGEYDGF